MDIDAAREVRRKCIVQPVIIGKPDIFFGEHDQIAGAFVIEPDEFLFFSIIYKAHSGIVFNVRSNVVFDAAVVQIDMGDLMICQREGSAATAIERLESKLVFDCDPASTSKNAVQVNWLLDWCDAVLGEDHDSHRARLKETDQIADD